MVNGGAWLGSDAGYLGHFGPGLAAGIGGTAQAVTSGYEAYRQFSAMRGETDPAARAERERNGWNATGEATVGGLHAGLGSWNPMAEAYIGGGELALDATGTVSGILGGDDAEFTAGSAVGGVLDAAIPDESDSLSNRAGRWVDRAVGGGIGGGILGMGAAGLTQLAAAPFNVADAATGGVMNTIGNIVDRDRNQRDDYWGAAKTNANRAFDKLLSW